MCVLVCAWKEELQNYIKSLDIDIKNFSLEAEEKMDMALLVKANSFRKTKENKLVNVEALETAVSKLENDLRKIYFNYNMSEKILHM